eukprot:jgi/Botrbrau1/9788/Bobra.85_1s0032.1
MAVTRWIPLESNPEVLNRFASVLGLDVSKVTFSDVYGLDPELLAFLPGKALAFLLLFPITEATEKAKAEEEEALAGVPRPGSDNVYFLRQTIGNACGTIAMLHAVGNNLDNVTLDNGSFLDRFYSDTANLDPEARGKYLEDPGEGAPSIDDAHREAAEDGQTSAPDADTRVDLHFIAIAERGNQIWELDGRKLFPISHGPSSPETFVEDAVRVMKSFIDKASGALNFNIMALCAAD